MTTKTYNTLEGTLTVRGAATATRTGGANAVAIVGGYDKADAASSVTAGEANEVTDPTAAEQTLGECEIQRMAEAVAANGVGDIEAVPVAETQTTESFSAQSMTLSNAPIFDPNVHPEHSITVTDTVEGVDLDVNIVYAESPSTPSTSNTANVNPINGKVETDASTDYDVTYTYGDYAGALSAVADLPVRSLIVGTEAASVKATIVSELSDAANNFDFKRAYVGAKPNLDASAFDSYTPDEQHWRLVEVTPARGQGADGEVRTCAAVGGFMSAQPIGPDGSGLYDEIHGLSSLNKSYRSSDVQTLDGKGVTAVTRNGVIGNAETTSSEPQFQPIYVTEIVDRVGEGLFSIAEGYAGGPQDVGDLETLLRTQLQTYSRGNPPDLGFARDTNEAPYDVSVSLGSDSSIANAGVTIVPYPIAETINLNLTVADGFVSFEGAT